MQHLPNPRVEAKENDLLVQNDALIGLGLTPIRLSEELISEISNTASRYAHRCRIDKFALTALSRMGELQEVHGITA